jgi:hypothetical protein
LKADGRAGALQPPDGAGRRNDSAKEEINSLLEQTGQQKKYKIVI